ncbi:MAG: SipW-dependent-type signal peptide-containing protein [Prevotella pectinovora]
MKTRSKALLLTLCAVLLVTASVLGTMAYLTSTASVENTFTVGSVKITLDEAKVTTDGKPVGGAARVAENSYKLMPGHTYTKDPTIHVDAASEDCFIRAKVTLTNASEWIEIATKYADNKVENIIKGTDDNIWWVSQPAVDTANNTVTYTFVYKNESHTDELGKRIWTSTDSKDLVLFKEIAIPGGLTNDELAAVGSSKITVVAEAIQADGFENEAAAWAAFDAQK